jgi:hypothetical protein
MGLTIHFDRNPPEELEQWLGTEARYVIGSFEKGKDLQKVYGERTAAVIAECRALGEKIVSGITLVLDADMRKLRYVQVRLRNGESFVIDDKYSPIAGADAREQVEAMIRGNGPELISVSVM